MERTGNILETTRLALRAWTLADAEPFLAIYGDPAVTQHLTQPPLADLDAARALLTRVLEVTARNGFGHYAVIERETGALVGSCGFRPGPEPATLEVGFTIAASRWGRGYATEITAACVRYGFERLGAHGIVSLTRPENAAARRVLEKTGFRYAGNEEHDRIAYVAYAIEPGH